MYVPANQGSHGKYDVDKATRKYIVNEEEAKTVRKIFEMYSEGSGYLQILSYINSMGYKTKTGKCFGKNSLYSILHNEKYSGVYIFNKKLEKSVSGTRNPKIKDKSEWIVIEGGVPAIVDKETFDKVQIKLQSNLKEGGKFKAIETYLLSSLVYCGECGSSMYMPHDLPEWQLVYYYWRKWQRKNRKGFSTLDHVLGIVEDIHRAAKGRELSPSMLIGDSKTMQNADTAEEKGYDGAKKNLA